jgi:2-oxoglutarate dehydrogenase E1 component
MQYYFNGSHMAIQSLGDIFTLAGSNAGFVQELYELYQTDPTLVGGHWAELFSSVNGGSVPAHYSKASLEHTAPRPDVSPAPSSASTTQGELLLKVMSLIQSYRAHGHLRAAINPLTKGILPLPVAEDLSMAYHGITEAERRLPLNPQPLPGCATAEEVALRLALYYSGSIGFEFNHLINPQERAWLQARIESRRSEPTAAQRKRAYRKLVEAEEFEAQLHKKYVGQKRFSLQGGEALLPILDTVIDSCGELGVSEVVLGKAHRGRLNVLCNIVGKPIKDLFTEFDDQALYSYLGAGDVKYHKGYRSTYQSTSGAPVQMMLAPNPSHLEFVNPVVEGIARAKQDITYAKNRSSVLPILMHGDAAFVGQGIVTETLNLSTVQGYATGGTFHIIINNQIGFTTNPDESRSTIYCTDFAKAVQAPIFHVNGEDVDAVLWLSRLALEFRQEFKRDIVIDMYCYRKYGHNEGDDPSFTQPLTYSEVSVKKSVMNLYGEKLVTLGIITEEERLQEIASYVDHFQAAHNTKNVKVIGEACPMFGRLRIPTPETGVSRDRLVAVAQALTSYPEGFVPHPKLHTILEKRVASIVAEGKGIEWGAAEALAYGTLLQEGVSVRLSGQDCGRGTFSHRHLQLNHHERSERYHPLDGLKASGSFEVINSTLSEAAVLGFEFGYATTAQRSLVMWEGQFGDFANGAQVIIDQFISSSEAKWDQLSGVTMLLPHGFEGQGPEHSSARLERYLQLCAEGNMVVCYPSNAAQQFHLLRRQGVMELRRPLIVMTPKSLLRLPEASSSIEAFTTGQFEPVLEETISAKGAPKNVVMLTGKIYYEVVAALKKAKNPSVRVLRIEQLHPFPQFELKRALKDLNPKKVFWVQEEPQNMGAWGYLESYVREKVGIDPCYIGRPAAASPATGSNKRHLVEQKKIIDDLLAQLA